MAESIVSISLITNKFDINISNLELISYIEKSQMILKPKNFRDLYNQVFSESKFEPNQIILGFLPEGKKIEIEDDKIYEFFKNKISIYLGYRKQNSDKTCVISKNKNNIIEKEIINKLKAIPVPSNKELVEKQKEEIRKLKTELSDEIIDFNNNLLNELFEDFDGHLNDYLCDKYLKQNCFYPKLRNLRYPLLNLMMISLRKLRKDVVIYDKQLLKKRNKLLIDNKNEKIFKFCDESIFVEKTIKNWKFELKNIKIKNISQKEYKSDKLIWFKEEQSNKDINFDQNIIKNDYIFIKDQIFPSEKEIDNLSLNLCINRPKEANYIMFVSIKDNQSNNIISENPLKITVKMKKELMPILFQFDSERIKAIWKNLSQLNFFHLISNCQKEINEVIKKENGNVSRIKMWVMKKIENEKKRKINELLNKYENDFNYTHVDKDESQKMKIILDLKFDEEKIKKWIKENSDKNKIKIREIYNRLEDDFVISAIIDDEEAIAKIIELNYDYERLKVWAEEII